MLMGILCKWASLNEMIFSLWVYAVCTSSWSIMKSINFRRVNSIGPWGRPLYWECWLHGSWTTSTTSRLVWNSSIRIRWMHARILHEWSSHWCCSGNIIQIFSTVHQSIPLMRDSNLIFAKQKYVMECYFQLAHQQDVGSIRSSCHRMPEACHDRPCMHGGKCFEGWNRYICQCEHTSFAGASCGNSEFFPWPLKDGFYLFFKAKKLCTLQNVIFWKHYAYRRL